MTYTSYFYNMKTLKAQQKENRRKEKYLIFLRRKLNACTLSYLLSNLLLKENDIITFFLFNPLCPEL